MSKFNACVLVTRNGSNPEQMAQKARDILANFDINKEMKPYKYYIKADQIQQMAKHYGIDPANLSVLAEKLEEWDGNKGGADENGFYGISTKNPDGRIDSWEVFAEVKPEDRARLLFGEGGEEKTCKAVVAPDGKWIDGPWIYNTTPLPEEKEELEAWDKRLNMLLDEHKDSVAFLAACHI